MTTAATTSVSSREISDESLYAAGQLYPGWKTVTAGAIALTFGPSTMTIMSFGSFVPALDKEFGWGIPAISLGATILTYMITLTSLLQGYLVDKFKVRSLIVFSIPVFAVSLGAVSLLTNDITLFYLAWVVVPLCGVGAWPISYLKVTSGWFDRRLGFALGLTNAGIGVGATLLPIIISHFIASYGWRTAYLCLAAFALLITWPVVIAWLRENSADRPESPTRVAGRVPNELNLREALRTPTLWFTLGAFALLGILSVGMLVHLIKIFLDAGLAPQTAAFIMSTLGAALIIGRIGTGWLLDRFNASSVMVVFALGTAVACATLANGAAADVTVATTCAFLIGLVIGAEFDALSYMIPRYWGRKAFGKIYGTVFAAFQFAAGLGAVGLGFSRAHFESYSPALWVLAGLMVSCALLFSQLGPYRFGRRGIPSAAPAAATA